MIMSLLTIFNSASWYPTLQLLSDVFLISCRVLQGIFHFQLGRGEPMLHTRLRPHCKEFLEKIAKLYELHVFTFGSRLYAHTIAGKERIVLHVAALFHFKVRICIKSPYAFTFCILTLWETFHLVLPVCVHKRGVSAHTLCSCWCFVGSLIYLQAAVVLKL